MVFETGSLDLIDISPLINKNLAVWPGDCAFSRSESMSLAQGQNLTLSKMTATLHLGAHADAPSHYSVEGRSIEQQDLSLYLGPCQVLNCDPKGMGRITVEEMELSKISRERVLLRTDSFLDPSRWNSDFRSLSPELIEAFAQKGVRLVGIDTPSVDPQEDKKLLSHKAIDENNMAILEGLVLQNVEEGLYTLIALPLKIEQGDASPVRAVLLKN